MRSSYDASESEIHNTKKVISQAACKTGLKMSFVQSGTNVGWKFKDCASVAVRNPKKASSEKVRRT